MKLTSLEHSSIAVLSFFSLIIFLHLGAGEIQPWNEGLHAMRARGIVELRNYNAGLSANSSGMAPAQVYPPLNVMMITASMKLFGENEFSARLFSAVCSALALVLLYLLARRFVSNELSIAAAILLVGTLAWNTYSRLGMSSIPLTTFFLASLWAAVNVKDSTGALKAALWSAVYLLAVFFAMMTETIVSVLPLIFIAALVKEKSWKRNVSFLAAAFTLALLASVYWYVRMSNIFGATVSISTFLPAPLSDFEGGTGDFGIFRFLNIIIVSNPFFLLSFIFAGIVMASYRKISLLFDPGDAFLVKALTMWFMASLVVFAFIAGRYPHFIIFIVPPASLIAVKMFAHLDRLVSSRRLVMVIVTVLASAAVWSFVINIRDRADKFFQEGEYISLSLVFFGGAIIISLVYALFASEKHLKNITASLVPRLWFMLLICIIIRIVAINSLFNPGFSFGAEKTASIIKNYGVSSFVYLYHQRLPSDSLNPQLAWYTDGWTYGWQKTKSFKPLDLPEESINYFKLRSIDNMPDMPVIYYVPEDLDLARSVIKDIMETRPVISLTHNYIIFGRKIKNRPGGVMI